MAVSVRKDLPVSSFRELVEMLRSKGAELKYGSGGVGAQSHLICLYLSQLTNSTPLHVPYRGSGPAMTALLGGQIDFTCDQAVGVLPYVDGGKVKVLAVTSAKRMGVLPTVPTTAEQGLPEFQSPGWVAFFAPAKTAPAIVERLNAAARAALRDPDVRKKLIDLGNELPAESAQTPAALRAWMANELDRWVPLIKKAGIVGE